MSNATHLLRSHSFGRTFAFAAVVVGLLAIPASTAFAARILSSSDAALSGALLENFDSYSATEFTDQTFSIGADGFTVDPIAGAMQIDATWCDDFGTTGSCLGTNSSSGVNDDFDVTFTGDGVSAFGFEITALDIDWTIQTFDVTDTLLGTYVISSQSPGLTGFNRAGYFGATEASPIKYFTVRSAGGDWALVDDFSYAPVPEPSAAVLAVLGLMGLSRFGRNRA